MSQPQTVEAARVRIQRLVDEISALSKGDMRSEEYYQQFLTRSVAACDGRGGAIWLVGQRSADGKGEFQLAAAVELESSAFQSDEQQRAVLLRALAEVVQTKKPYVVAAESGQQASSIQAQLAQMANPAPATPNKTPYPFVQVPLFLKEQVLGVLQVWLQPYVTRDNYSEFCNFLTQLATHAEQHFQSRRMGNMVVENQRLQHLLKYVTDITGTLEPLEVSRLTVSYGRDLFGCERCALLRLRGGTWETMSISGQEVVEKKSTMVKTLTAFVGAHTPLEPVTFTPEGAHAPDRKAVVLALAKKELIALGLNDGTVSQERALVLRPHGSTTEVVDAAFFESSQAESLLIAQILDADKNVIGALLAESATVGFFEAPTGAKEASSHRLADWISGNAGRALKSAFDYKDLPMLFATRRLREVKRGITGTHRGRYLFKLIAILTILGGILFFPWMEEVESDCTLVPEQRVKIVPEIAGRVETIFVREGNIVKAGDPIAKIETFALDAELAHTREELVAANAEVTKYRGLNDPASEQISLAKARGFEQQIKRLQRDIEMATLRAPINGAVLTKDIELFQGMYLSAGADFAVLGTIEKWDLHVHIHEKEVGKVEKLFKKEGKADVRFILYTHNQDELHGELRDKSQLSQIAYPHERENAVKENAFILTLPNVSAPEEVRRGFRPDLTGRASIRLGRTPVIFMWARNIANWVRLKWVW